MGALEREDKEERAMESQVEHTNHSVEKTALLTRPSIVGK
jgi:hypothetical protein